jgi:8-oxo-dGTP diphosphatase
VVIEAAGGVVWRRSAKGSLKVLLVHRPRYDDWTLPKGKLDPGESAKAAALREVEEETGLRCRLGPALPSVRYTDAQHRGKHVRYWAMEPEDGEFAPNDEVDEVRWLKLAPAGELLTYAHDRPVLTALERALDETARG